MATNKDRFQYTFVLNDSDKTWLCESEEPIFEIAKLMEHITGDFDRSSHVFKVMPLSEVAEIGFDTLMDRNKFWIYCETAFRAATVICEDTETDGHFELY